jgi:enoyl-CoA hydratase/carnithine racemase
VARSGPVVANGKRTFYEQLDLPLAPAYTRAGAAMVSDVLSPDAAEGIAAFLAKRPPAWPSVGQSPATGGVRTTPRPGGGA